MKVNTPVKKDTKPNGISPAKRVLWSLQGSFSDRISSLGMDSKYFCHPWSKDSNCL